MKAVIVREEIYTLELNGHTITGAKVISNWEGLTKLVCDEGVLIVSGLHPNAGFNRALETLFDGPKGEVQVLMASPGLSAMLLESAAKAE